MGKYIKSPKGKKNVTGVPILRYFADLCTGPQYLEDVDPNHYIQPTVFKCFQLLWAAPLYASKNCQYVNIGYLSPNNCTLCQKAKLHSQNKQNTYHLHSPLYVPRKKPLDLYEKRQTELYWNEFCSPKHFVYLANLQKESVQP